MTADTSGATPDYSTGQSPARGRRGPSPRALPGLVALRGLCAVAGVAGAVLLIASTWATVVQIRVLTTSSLAGQDTALSGNDLHGIVMVPVALFALVMLAGALRGARPAMVALAATGLLALGLVIGLDVPELHNTGQIARFYEDVSAGSSTGFYLETLGAVLLLVAGGALLLLGLGSGRGRSGAGSDASGAVGGGPAAESGDAGRRGETVDGGDAGDGRRRRGRSTRRAGAAGRGRAGRAGRSERIAGRPGPEELERAPGQGPVAEEPPA